MRMENEPGRFLDGEGMMHIIPTLIGPIEPYGSHDIDQERNKNLSVWLSVTAQMLWEILDVAKYHTRHEFSICHIGKRADEFIKDWYEILGDYLKDHEGSEGNDEQMD